eukprot:SAG11_NODE_3838_length_2195_cov_2.830153_3_plen_404_part_00
MKITKSPFSEWDERSRRTGKPILKRAYPPAMEQLANCTVDEVLARARGAVGHSGWVRAKVQKIDQFGGYSPFFHCEHFAVRARTPLINTPHPICDYERNLSVMSGRCMQIWCKTESTADMVASNENQILQGWLASAATALPIMGATLQKTLQAQAAQSRLHEEAMIFMLEQASVTAWLRQDLVVRALKRSSLESKEEQDALARAEYFHSRIVNTLLWGAYKCEDLLPAAMCPTESDEEVEGRQLLATIKVAISKMLKFASAPTTSDSIQLLRRELDANSNSLRREIEILGSHAARLANCATHLSEGIEPVLHEPEMESDSVLEVGSAQDLEMLGAELELHDDALTTQDHALLQTLRNQPTLATIRTCDLLAKEERDLLARLEVEAGGEDVQYFGELACNRKQG